MVFNLIITIAAPAGIQSLATRPELEVLVLFELLRNPNGAIILICSFLLGAGLTAALGAQARSLGDVLGVIDEPCALGGHKQHSIPTPAVGGVIGLLAASIVLFATMPWTYPLDYLGRNTHLWVALAGALIMAIGFLDDRRPINATKRLVADVFVFSGLLWLIPQLRFTNLSFESLRLHLDVGQFGFPLALICLVGLKNAINMADGRNGLVLGLAFIWNAFFMLHAPAHILPILAGITGIFTILFIMNVQGRLFLGDCGSYGIATFFGILALALHNGPARGMRSAEGVLLFLIPVTDTLRLMVSRFLAGRSPLSADRRHLHHLLDMAFGWKIGWAVYMTTVAAPLILYQIIPGSGYKIILTVLILYSALVQYLENLQKRSAQLETQTSKQHAEKSPAA